MRRAHTVQQVRAAEAALMATLPAGTLMQRAAAGLAGVCRELLGRTYGARVGLLVGSGDNGGDTLFAGARLARDGARVEALLLRPDHAHPGGLRALRQTGGTVVDHLGPADLVLDGIVGIGGRPGLRDPARDVIEAVETAAGAPLIVAVDVPSGIDVDTGETPAVHVRADATVTFGTHKIGLLVGPGAAAAGEVRLVDIGLDCPPPAVEALEPPDVAALLPWPAADTHKYERGVVGVAAGSTQYPGAGSLAVSGAQAGFAGMVRFVTEGDDSRGAAIRAAHPEVVGAGRVQAWVVGPGGGDEAASALARVLDDGVPVVVDADALAAVSGPLPVPALLTPHAGELARMLGVHREQVEQAPLRHARTAAQRFAAVVLLKGDRTLVAHPDGRVRVNATGVPWLATAGAGDVLAGLCGSLVAAGLSPYDAGSLGAWLHGAASESASGGGPIVARQVAEQVRTVVGGLGGYRPSFVRSAGTAG